MKLRQLARARKAIQAGHTAWRKARDEENHRLWLAESLFEDNYDEYDADWACTVCGGEGWREVDDPLWDECDEFGYGPCIYCHGTGNRVDQTVF